MISDGGTDWQSEMKRRQHHVWRRYLESWCIDGRLYCRQEGRVFPNAPQNLAVESYFYRLDELTEEDRALYRKMLVEKGDAHQKASHERFLGLVTAPIEMAERLRQLGEDPKLDAVLDEFLKTYKTNALEDYYAGIEGDFGPILGRLLSGDLGVFSDEESAPALFYFLATQYMRTKGIRERFIESFRRAPFSVERIVPLLALQYGENIGRSLFLDRKNISPVILTNSTDVEFVTGDQPIVNLLAVPGRQAAELSLYYPLSPTSALLLSDSGRSPMVSNATFNESWAIELNRKIVENSHSQVFARTAAILNGLPQT